LQLTASKSLTDPNLLQKHLNSDKTVMMTKAQQLQPNCANLLEWLAHPKNIFVVSYEPTRWDQTRETWQSGLEKVKPRLNTSDLSLGLSLVPPSPLPISSGVHPDCCYPHLGGDSEEVGEEELCQNKQWECKTSVNYP